MEKEDQNKQEGEEFEMIDKQEGENEEPSDIIF